MKGVKGENPQIRNINGDLRSIVAVRSGVLTARTISCPTRGAKSASQRPTPRENRGDASGAVRRAVFS